MSSGNLACVFTLFQKNVSKNLIANNNCMVLLGKMKRKLLIIYDCVQMDDKAKRPSMEYRVVNRCRVVNLMPGGEPDFPFHREGQVDG